MRSECRPGATELSSLTSAFSRDWVGDSADNGRKLALSVTFVPAVLVISASLFASQFVIGTALATYDIVGVLSVVLQSEPRPTAAIAA